jgi:hypothetical protein
MTTPRRICLPTLRWLALAVLAWTAIGSVPGQADPRRTDTVQAAACGPAIAAIRDPEIRRSFIRFDAGQSAASQKICAIYRDDAAGLAAR